MSKEAASIMLKIIKDKEWPAMISALGYAQSRGTLSRNVLKLTRWLRAVNAEKYMTVAERHLDIGCGDGYFLRRSQCKERFGLDRLLGDEIKGKLDFSNAYFDYVTMLAVIEHIANPKNILEEIARVLKPDGKLIITTPKKFGEPLMRLYAKMVAEQHKMYFDLESTKKLSEGLFEIAGSHLFCFGLNQVFCLKKTK